MSRRGRKGQAPQSRTRIWRYGIALAVAVAILVMAWLEFSQLRPTRPPFVAVVRAPDVIGTRTGAVTIDLPGGGAAIVNGFIGRKLVKGDRVFVQELTTPVLGLHRYVLVQSTPDSYQRLKP